MKEVLFGSVEGSTRWYELDILRGEVILYDVIDGQRKMDVSLTRGEWDCIAEWVQHAFNVRLKQAKQRLGRWERQTKIEKLLGKELALLLYALQDQSDADRVYRNWSGLSPEERWWLHTTINATRHLPMWGKDHGWYKAVRIALSEE